MKEESTRIILVVFLLFSFLRFQFSPPVSFDLSYFFLVSVLQLPISLPKGLFDNFSLRLLLFHQSLSQTEKVSLFICHDWLVILLLHFVL